MPTLLLLAIACMARAAVAEEGQGPPKWAGSVYLWGGDTPIPTTLGKEGIIGLGYQLDMGMGPNSHWAWSANFGYGIGDLKEKITGPVTSTTNELSMSSYEIRLGADWWNDCCDKLWYCGPGFVYQSTSVTAKSTGNPDFDYKPFYTYGLEARLGGTIPMGKKWSLFGQTAESLTYGSYSQTESGTKEELTGWFTNWKWRGGVYMGY